MAFANYEEEEKKNLTQPVNQPQSPGGQTFAPVPTGPSGGVSGAPVNAAKATTPSTYATVDKYIAANEPQAQQLAQQVTGKIGDIGTQGTEAVNQFKTSAEQAITAGTPTPNQELVNRVISNPTAATPQDIEAFKAQKAALYQGPSITDIQGTPEYSKALENIGKVATQKELLGTEAGLKQVVQEAQKNKQAGITDLNTALLSLVPQAQQNVTAAAKALPTNLESLMSSILADEQNRIAAGQAAGTTASTYATGKLSDTQKTFEKQIADEVATALAARNQYNTSLQPMQQQIQDAISQVLSRYTNASSAIRGSLWAPRFGTLDTLLANLQPSTSQFQPWQNLSAVQTVPTSTTEMTPQQLAYGLALEKLGTDINLPENLTGKVNIPSIPGGLSPQLASTNSNSARLTDIAALYQLNRGPTDPLKSNTDPVAAARQMKTYLDRFGAGYYGLSQAQADVINRVAANNY
jgi:pyruvoyl-dependent arginine decarboxylase (PvlArgDC)